MTAAELYARAQTAPDPATADRYATRAILTDPDHAPAYALRALLAARRGDPIVAAHYFRAAYTRGDRTPATRAALAACLEATGETTAAARLRADAALPEDLADFVENLAPHAPVLRQILATRLAPAGQPALLPGERPPTEEAAARDDAQPARARPPLPRAPTAPLADPHSMPPRSQRPPLPATGSAPFPPLDRAAAAASTAPLGIPDRASTAPLGIPDRASTAPLGIPDRAPTAAPHGIPDRTSTGSLGIPDRAPIAAPHGIPDRASTGSLGIPDRASTGSLGIPDRTPTAAPHGIPDRASTGSLGIPDRASTGSLGIPDRAPTAAPHGIPDRAPIAAPHGIPDRAPTGSLGIPDRAATGSLGIPDRTPTTAAPRGIPSRASSTATPGIPDRAATAPLGIPDRAPLGIPDRAATAPLNPPDRAPLNPPDRPTTPLAPTPRDRPPITLDRAPLPDLTDPPRILRHGERTLPTWLEPTIPDPTPDTTTPTPIPNWLEPTSAPTLHAAPDRTTPHPDLTLDPGLPTVAIRSPVTGRVIDQQALASTRAGAAMPDLERLDDPLEARPALIDLIDDPRHLHLAIHLPGPVLTTPGTRPRQLYARVALGLTPTEILLRDADTPKATPARIPIRAIRRLEIVADGTQLSLHLQDDRQIHLDLRSLRKRSPLMASRVIETLAAALK